MSEILPCPHCGGTDSDDNACQQAAIYCREVKAATGQRAYKVECQCGASCAAELTPSKAIAAWNRRAPSPSPAPGVVEALRLAVDMVERDVIRVRPSDRDELLSALSVWNAALASPQPANPAQVTDAMVKDATTEFLSHKGERPWRCTRRGAELWEDYAPAMRAALTAAIGAGGQAVASPVSDDYFIQERDDDMLICAKHWQYGSICIARRPKLATNDEWRSTAQDIVNALSTITHPAPSGQAVAVKPLEWMSENDEFYAETIVGCYSVMLSFDEAWFWTLDDMASEDMRDPEKAKAAAQADFERRILSTIAHPVQPGWREDKKMPQPKGD